MRSKAVAPSTVAKLREPRRDEFGGPNANRSDTMTERTTRCPTYAGNCYRRASSAQGCTVTWRQRGARRIIPPASDAYGRLDHQTLLLASCPLTLEARPNCADRMLAFPSLPRQQEVRPETAGQGLYIQTERSLGRGPPAHGDKIRAGHDVGASLCTL